MRKQIVIFVVFSVVGTVGLSGCSNKDKQPKTISIETFSDMNNDNVSQSIISGSFAIRNVGTGKNIKPYNSDKYDGNDIILYPHNEWKCLTWQFNHIDGIAYQLENLYTQKTFEPKSHLVSGVTLWQQPLNNNSPQWEFIKQQDGVYAIRLKDTELYLTISSNKTDAAIILLPYGNTSSQQWKLIEQYPNV